MKYNMTNRQFLSGIIIGFYLIPLLFFASYSIHLMSPQKSWGLLSIGLLLVTCGALCLILLLYYWENSLRIKSQKESPTLLSSISPTSSLFEKETKVTSLLPLPTETYETEEQKNFDSSQDKEDFKEKYESLLEMLEIKKQELEELELLNQQLNTKAQQISQDFSDYKLFSEEQLKQKQIQFSSLQQTIEDQRGEMEKRQEHIHQLDTKVHDLSYEIKTLLYLHKEEIPKQNKSYAIELKQEEEGNSLPQTIQNTGEAVSLLRKYVAMAEKLVSTHYYTNEVSRYRDFSAPYYTIDQRRLFDHLRNEKSALIIIYSQKDNKLLFANTTAKILLGWNSEKFISDFFSIIQEGVQEWKKGLFQLTIHSETQIRMLAKTKQGQELLLDCHLGIVPSGLFRNPT
jgi:hypothetical protein